MSTRSSPPSSSGRPSRRDFVKTAAAGAAAALTFPTIVPSSVFGADNKPAPSQRLSIGVIGLGKQGAGHHLMGKLLGKPEFVVTALCDVDDTRLNHFKQEVENKYATLERKDYKGCATFRDHHELLARKDVDAVLVATPDHWHSAVSIDACRAGKDIYCEKPLTLTIHEAKTLIDVVRKYDRVFQTGSQQRSEGPFHQAVEIVRNGRLGKIKEVWVGIGKTSRPYDLPEQPVPKGLDFDRWLGQAPNLPYNDTIARGGKLPNDYPFNPGWRDFREFSGGYVTDWGAHHFDITQWALDMDHSGPVEILPPGSDAEPGYGAKFIYRGSPVGDEIVVTHKNEIFEHDAEEKQKDGSTKKDHKKETNGILFIGDKGRLFVNRQYIVSEPDGILKEPIGESDKHVFKSPGHHQNWLDCIHSRQRPICDVEIGARSVTVCHLVNLAYWHGKKLQWDPQKWEFTGDNAAEANGWRTREQRAPYQLPPIA